MTATPDPSEETLIGLNRLATVARLLSGAIHDVNNALQVISGTVELIESRPDVPPSMREALARLRAQSSRAAGTLTEVQLFTRATSLGGVESLIEHRASMEGPLSRTPAGLLRISIGLENSADLIADLEQALGD